MKAPFSNNLPTQTGDVIVNPINPVNPDSKPHAAARTRLNCPQFLYNPINQKKSKFKQKMQPKLTIVFFLFSFLETNSFRLSQSKGMQGLNIGYFLLLASNLPLLFT